MTVIRRLWAFLVGNMAAAEDIADRHEVDRVSWIDHVGTLNDPALAKHALEAAIRSAEDSRASVEGIQARASSLLTLLIGLVPLLIAAIGLAAPRGGDALLRGIAVTGYVGASATLLASIVMASLATGLTLGGGLNLARLSRNANEPSTAALAAAEADAWHHASMLAMEAATRKAHDLFRARQFSIWALTLAVLATVVLVLAVDGKLAELVPTESSPLPTPTISPADSG